MVILKLRIRTADEWRELAPSDSATDPVFVPTTDELEPQQAVIIEVSSQLLPNKVLVRGTVQSWRPALPRMRVRAGATIDLAPDEQIKLTFLHEVFAGKRTDVPRRRHHRLPVSVSVRYRLANSSSFVDSAISEIGVGGALLMTPEPLPIDTELTLEVTPPGAAAPIAIAGRVSYHVPSGGTGLRFVSRDGDGDRRLRELIRRLRAS
jgi:hypothetical protein